MPQFRDRRSARVVGVIPARWGSTRFPGKMLADLHGQPLVVRTFRAAGRAKALDRLLVATDDTRIRDAVTACGGEVVMTDSSLPSGSDRILAALEGIPCEVVVNIQGDEPLLPPEVIDRAVELLAGNGGFGVTTAASPITDPTEYNDPNVVKVVTDSSARALYFSRCPVPYVRNIMPSGLTHRRHIGVYVYRREVLEDFCAREPSLLEKCEGLEQLRLLEHGVGVGVVDMEKVPPGVDTPEDLERVRDLFGKTSI